jgi:replication factor C subunit 3/5
MFYINKYTPDKHNSIIFHKPELEKLKIMSQDDSIPHILFYGPDGCGKKTIISKFLEMLYDKKVNDVVDSIYNVSGSGNSVTQVTIKQSNYHIIIEPNNNNFDRYLIQDVVKEYAKRMPLCVFSAKKVFKTVLINNVDNLSFHAQTSLRRTLELYSNTCRFIMWSRTLSKVIKPLRSRCSLFKIDSPSELELYTLLVDISGKEQINIEIDECIKILNKSNRNIKKLLWLLQLYKLNNSYDTSYDTSLITIKKLLLTKNIQNILQIRELLYHIMITNIDSSTIVKDLLLILLKSNITDKQKITITELAAQCDHNLIRGRRDIIHLETFIINIIVELNNK